MGLTVRNSADGAVFLNLRRCTYKNNIPIRDSIRNAPITPPTTAPALLGGDTAELVDDSALEAAVTNTVGTAGEGGVVNEEESSVGTGSGVRVVTRDCTTVGSAVVLVITCDSDTGAGVICASVSSPNLGVSWLDKAGRRKVVGKKTRLLGT